MSRVMISYRRSHSAGISGRIYDRLSARFGAGSVFMDVDAIPFGVDFSRFIDEALRTIDFVVLVIGIEWLGPLGDGTARIDRLGDPVRLELEMALANHVRIVPVLVDGVKMPNAESLPASLKSIALLNAVTIDSGIDFEIHVERLLRALSAEPANRSPRTPGLDVEASIDNLPRSSAPLIGRGRELAELEALLATARLITITGAGGVGKTRTALALASNVRHAFVDGAWFVDLAALRGHDLVQSTIASTLGIRPAAGTDVSTALLTHLARRALVLVIDNCEHLIGEVASAVDAILKSAPYVCVLATSREPLDVEGERVYRLPSLALPHIDAELTAAKAFDFGAIALFVERATAVESTFLLTDETAAIVGDICRRLDGIALAIELAAARTSAMRVTEIRERLDERFRILTKGRRTALPRQQTMRATIDWSYDLLDARKQRLFRRLGIFANGFTGDGAIAVGKSDELDDLDLLDDLGSLIDKSLVMPSPAADALRYRLLESTREYALEKLEVARERDETAKRFGEWCHSFVGGAHDMWATAPTKRWFAHVRPEIENVRAALVWSLELRNDVLLGQSIAARARRLWGRVAPVEGKKWSRMAGDLAHDGTPREIVSALWLGDAHVHTALQEYKRALVSAERAREGYERDRESLDYWEACGFLGCAMAMLGRGSEAEPLLLETIAAYKRVRADQLTAGALVDLAFSHLMRDDVNAAREVFEEALTLFRSVENERGMGSVAINLAEIEFRAGNIDEAIRYGEAALASSSEEQLSVYLVNLTAYLIAADRFEDARDRARDSVLRSGVPRTEMDVVYSMLHFAAISALRISADERKRREDHGRAAFLLGYVDARLDLLESRREFIEQIEYERAVDVLRESLGPERYARLHDEGRKWTDAHALLEAERV